MLVKDWMTAKVTTIAPDTPVLEAGKVMKAGGFRRLPVVDRGKLVGIVTDRDLKEAAPSDVTSLSIWELNYLLTKLRVKEVMNSPVITVTPEDMLESAALVMADKRIGGLVVMDGAEVTGIITITDVLRAFIEILGLSEGGLRVTVQSSDVPGQVEKVGAAAKPSNVVSIATVGRGDGTRRMLIRVKGDQTQSFPDRLKQAGFEILSVREA